MSDVLTKYEVSTLRPFAFNGQLSGQGDKVLRLCDSHEQLRAENAALLQENSELHRRCQQTESSVTKFKQDWDKHGGPKGGNFGRALLATECARLASDNAAKDKRIKALAEISDLPTRVTGNGGVDILDIEIALARSKEIARSALLAQAKMRAELDALKKRAKALGLGVSMAIDSETLR